MKALIIVLAAAGLLLLIGMIRITVDLRKEDDLLLTLRLLGLRLKLLPKKKKPPKLKNFRIRNFRKMRIREEKKALAALRRKVKKARKAQRKAEAAGKPLPQEQKPEKRSLRETVAFVTAILRHVPGRVLRAIGRYLRIDLRQLSITAAGKEPAEAAKTYGILAQATAYLTELADHTLKMRYPNGREGIVTVDVDFLTDRMDFRFDLSVSIRVWQIPASGIAALKGYLSARASLPRAKQEASEGDPPDANKTSGEPKDSDPMNGNAKECTPKDGKPKDGKPKDGKPTNGMPKNGKPKIGRSERGAPKQDSVLWDNPRRCGSAVAEGEAGNEAGKPARQGSSADVFSQFPAKAAVNTTIPAAAGTEV